MKKATINLYEFGELSAEAKEYAIGEHRDFLANTTQPEDFEDMDDFFNEIREIEHSDNYVIDNIDSNEYLFFVNGQLAPCTTYTEEHPKAGTTELKLEGEIYEVF